MYSEETFSSLDAIDREEFVIASYYVESRAEDLLRRAAAIAVEQTTGTWVPVPEETPEVRRKHVGRVVTLCEAPDYEMELPDPGAERCYFLQIAFPTVNFGAQIPMLLSTVIGNISMAGKLKLVDLGFPQKFLAGFQGPRFGIAGVREILGVPQRPLLNNMIKPCTGITPEVGARLFYEAARGGCDIIKDDELTADPEYSPLEERVRAFMKMERRAFEETGEHTLYTVNITDSVGKLKQNAFRALEAGTNALMVNYLTVGISALQMLAEDPKINVPILAHLDFAGTMYESPTSGMSSHLVLGKLPRLAGADVVVYPCPYGKFAFMREKHVRIALSLRMRLGSLKPTFPMPGGGVHPGNLPLLMDDLGTDWVIGAGGAVHGHPLGPAAGARALRQAIDALMTGRSLRDAADEFTELRAAIEAWGLPGEKEAELFEMR